MKRRSFRRVLAVLCLVVAGVFGLVWWVTTPEPVYGGKPLSQWLVDYNPGNDLHWHEADLALDKIGTNAIPTLLYFLRVRDSTIKVEVVQLLKKQHVIRFNHVSDTNLNFAAVIGFRKLGPAAACAVPKMIDLYRRNISPWSRSATVMALDDLAPFSIPELAHELSNRQPSERELIASLLARAETPPSTLMPALILCLHDHDPAVRESGVSGLARLDTNAQSALPDLLQLRSDTNVDVSNAVAYALPRVTPRANN